MSNLTRKKNTRNYEEKLVNMPTNTRENIQAAINNFTKYVHEKHQCTPDKICGELIEIKKTDGEGEYEDALYNFLQEWIDWNISIKTGAYTIRTRFSILRKYLYFLGIKTDSQDIKQLLDFPRKIVEEKYAIKKQEIRDLVLAQSRNPKRQALYLACSSSGMRLGEALHIKKKDLDFSLDRIMIRIDAEYTKTKAGRTTFVSKECEEKIMMYYEKLGDDEYVFSNSKSDFKGRGRVEQTAMGNALEKLGYTEKYSSNGFYKITSHCFRAYFFTAATRKHNENYAHKMTGHGGYLIQYDRYDDADVVDVEDEDDNDHLIFQLKSKKIQSKPNWISVTQLFTEGPASVLTEKEIQTTDPNYAKYLQRLMELYNRKENYYYPVQILDKEKSYAEVTDVFVRVNSAGMKLRTADLALAQVTSRWIGAMELFSKVVAECQESKYDLDEGFLIKCLVSVSTGQNKFKLINKIPISQLKEDWEKTKRGLHFAINFLKENAKIETSEILSSPFLVIPIVCLAVKNKYKFTDLLERQILRWFYAAAMWSRYSRASESTLDEDLSVIEKEENPLKSMTEKILARSGRIEVKELDLEGKDTRSAFFVMSYVLAKRNNAKDWGSGLTFSLQHLGREYKNEYDHIFPRSKLDPFLMKKYGDKQKVKRLVNDIANIAFLTKGNNIIKSNKLPQEYFRTLINERGEDALTAQNITLDDSLWSLDNYEEFLKDRRKKLVKGINQLMESLEKGEPEKKKPLEEIFKEGETFTREFKASLRWDYKQNKSNRELYYPILKTLTGFMNSDGGILYVGVSNDGEVLGIEKDYETFEQGKNWDEWSKAFSSIISSKIGPEFNVFIKANPITINGNEIAEITVLQASRPAYIDPADKAQFHIRAGTTTQSLNPKETSDYIKDHFS